MRTTKFIIRLVSIIIIGIGLFIYMLIYTALLNNNMDMCMNHYKDYDYCSRKVGE